MKYRSLFISDVHLGVNHTNIEHLLSVLRENEFENIFLIGDIIDGWKLRRSFSWDENANTFLQKIFRAARKGSNIVYIIGNHDEFLYKFEGQSFGNISIKEEHIHETASGEKILLIHGHQFDGIVKCNKWLQHIGSVLYETLLDVNVFYNKVRRFFGYKYWSLSKFLKTKTKEVVNYVASFEDALTTYAQTKGADAVMCGHIHTPKITNSEINYYNCGDFVENKSYIVETIDGEISLIHCAAQN
jgi:UDP-2,3-diacylglucosamine pyrophosphatase LpxH